MADKIYSIRNSIRNLTALLVLDKKDIYTIYWFAILAGMLGLSLPLGIQSIIGFVQTNAYSTSLAVLIGLVLIGTFFIGLLQVRQMQLLEKVKQKIFVRYSLEYSDRIPKFNLEKLDQYYLPELVNRFFDTILIQKGISKILLDMPAAVIQILFGILLLAFYNPVFIGFGVLLIILLILILSLTSTEGFHTAMRASNYKYKMAAWLQDLARGIYTFKFTRESSLHIRKTDKILEGFLTSRTDFFKVLLIQFWTLITFKVLITAAMLIVGAYLLLDNKMSVGQFVAAEIVIVNIISSVEKLIGNLDTVYDTLVSVDKLSKVANAPIESQGSIQLSPSKEGLHIKFDQVSYQYPGGQNAVQDLSFELKPGKIGMISGKSGTGKSTVLQLLTGALKSYQGTILIDGVPLHNYNISSLRNQIGLLFSQQDIFQGTLLENITMGDPNIGVADIHNLAQKLGFSDYIATNIEGYDTELDPIGKKLSGKAKQIILILRALLGKHRLLLLESPFNSLNDDNKNALIQFLKNESQLTTLIVTEYASELESVDVHIKL